MKLICIGRNYVKHIEELGNEKSESPIIFLKPDSALIENNDPCYYPDFSSEIHYEVEILVKIKKNIIVSKIVIITFLNKIDINIAKKPQIISKLTVSIKSSFLSKNRA